MKYGGGWLPSIPDHRNYTERTPKVATLLARTRLAARVAPFLAGPSAALGTPPGVTSAPFNISVTASSTTLPSSVDLRSSFSSINNQGAIGSCTAEAACGLVEYFELARGNPIKLSPLFLYKVERDLLGLTGDTGAFQNTAMQAFAQVGCTPEQYWPYNVANYDIEPPTFCYALAGDYRAVVYFLLSPAGVVGAQLLNDMKTYIAAGLPSIFGFPIYPEYDNPAPGGLVAFPAPAEKSRGGHSNVVAGYDDNLVVGGVPGALLVRNSWGTGWGNAGYGWLSYQYVLQNQVTDVWSMSSINWVQMTNPPPLGV